MGMSGHWSVECVSVNKLTSMPIKAALTVLTELQDAVMGAAGLQDKKKDGKEDTLS